MDTIRVFANPHHAQDHKGECHAAVPFIDEEGTLHLHRFVGAAYDLKRSGAWADEAGVLHAKKNGYVHVDDKGTKSKHGEGRVMFTFSDEPQTVPFEGPAKAYYARKVLDGELLAADQESADACGVKDFGLPKDDCKHCTKHKAAKKAADDKVAALAEADAKKRAEAKAKADAEAKAKADAEAKSAAAASAPAKSA